MGQAFPAEVDTQLSGGRNNKPFSTYYFSRFSNVPCKKQPRQRDSFQQPLSKTDAVGTKRICASQGGVGGSDPIRRLSEARSKAAALSLILTTGDFET